MSALLERARDSNAKSPRSSPRPLDFDLGTSSERERAPARRLAGENFSHFARKTSKPNQNSADRDINDRKTADPLRTIGFRLIGRP